MEIMGLDLHKRASQLSSKADDGTITDRRIVTSRERFTAVLGGRPRARILLEASTESEWVSRHLESLGHEEIVADPNCAPMYANRSRRTKTDRRDARTLMGCVRDGGLESGVPALGAAPPCARRARGARSARARCVAVLNSPPNEALVQPSVLSEAPARCARGRLVMIRSQHNAGREVPERQP